MRLEVYVAVEDMERAVAFYSRLFREEPVRRTPKYAGYRSGFGLMLSTGYSVPVQRGNSAVPTLIVENLDTEHARIEPPAPTVTAITQVGDFRLFMFIDPDGNVIEMAQTA